MCAVAQVQGVELDTPEPIPEFLLSSADGQVFSHDDLKGSWSIIMFGFNSCPDVCPFTLGNLEHAISETALRVRPESLPKVVFVSVDPDRDAAGVDEYAKYFHPKFRGVSGARDQMIRAGLHGRAEGERSHEISERSCEAAPARGVTAAPAP